jgi:hypothetical protein
VFFVFAKKNCQEHDLFSLNTSQNNFAKLQRNFTFFNVCKIQLVFKTFLNNIVQITSHNFEKFWKGQNHFVKFKWTQQVYIDYILVGKPKSFFDYWKSQNIFLSLINLEKSSKFQVKNQFHTIINLWWTWFQIKWSYQDLNCDISVWKISKYLFDFWWILKIHQNFKVKTNFSQFT